MASDDAQMREENYRYLLISLAHGYLMIFHADPDYPDWVTFINSGFPNAGPNPDTIYWYSPIRADGVYRISGTRAAFTTAISRPPAGCWGCSIAPVRD